MKKRSRICITVALVVLLGVSVMGGFSALAATSSTAGSVKDYFPVKPNTRYVYEGSGNEYAFYDVVLDYFEGAKMQQRVDNGGTVMAKVIEVRDGVAKLVYTRPEVYYRENFLTQKKNTNEILLKEPLRAGTMPANVFVSYDDALSAILLKAAPVRAERFVNGILAGAGKRLRPHYIDRLFAKIFSIEKKKSGLFGKKLKAGDDCTGCAWCASNCPRGNIEMKDGKPSFGARCVICLRCVYDCPAKAIRADVPKFFLLKEGLDLDALEERTKHMTDFPPVSEAAKGFLYKGVRRYLKELM